MILLSAKSKMTSAFCAMSSSEASTFSSSGSATGTEREIGLRDELRRSRIPSAGLPKSLSEAMLSTLAIAAVGLPTSARGEPGKRSIGFVKLLGELDSKESGRGEDASEYGCGTGGGRVDEMANGGVPELSDAGAVGGYGEVGDGPEVATPGVVVPIVLSGRVRNPRDGRRATTLSRFGTFASSACRGSVRGRDGLQQ